MDSRLNFVQKFNRVQRQKLTSGKKERKKERKKEGQKNKRQKLREKRSTSTTKVSQPI